MTIIPVNTYRFGLGAYFNLFAESVLDFYILSDNSVLRYLSPCLIAYSHDPVLRFIEV
jgi:hypothetical protein